ncbi:MAG: type II toxin-antitoxin system prevent-host-death family antitoxin [Betaproteobacteria bacterium]|nr:type II toxin-antitoxin system prevent-host-death family antitoxin [Betaproteobacteria bacterium]
MTESVVSIRELKSRLSHYLRLARGGESVIITDRGVPVGRLVPIAPDLEGRISALRNAGLLHWSGRRLSPRKPTVRIPKGKTVAELIIEDRG